ncbi:hypothetical protein AAZX31_11G125100 [Glycine max]|uniref:uncharacterized protein LOC114374913 n=1 Tax=Glycine soja TaxID=3848 RepID=UPI000860FAE1|nr:uncharacterized protein LOC114374913 [Glycine soja]KAG4386788.1 hypothetical protein GLYMA_11G127750v4 [Glycine max]KAG4386789.1 hypothetical protein GLYMA_11G127750v4 [Glycine max]KAH1158878.1 hypothetical protein GYH30_030876 [Glycine max]KAH1158879.1 hypothetical protein GYH30_030876 [Glycine max]
MKPYSSPTTRIFTRHYIRPKSRHLHHFSFIFRSISKPKTLFFLAPTSEIVTESDSAENMAQLEEEKARRRRERSPEQGKNTVQRSRFSIRRRRLRSALRRYYRIMRNFRRRLQGSSRIASSCSY